MRASSRRGAVLAAVVLGHAGLAGLLMDTLRRPAPFRPAPRSAEAPPRTPPAIVWWLPPPLPRAADAPDRPARAPLDRTAQRTVPPRPPATVAPTTARRAAAEAVHEPVGQAITLPATAAAAPAASPVPPSPPASQPLDLRLRHTVEPPSPAALARHDARLPSRPDADARLARALGTDQRLSEQSMADGLRLRQGRGCVDLRPARATALDTFNASARPVPRLASEC